MSNKIIDKLDNLRPARQDLGQRLAALPSLERHVPADVKALITAMKANQALRDGWPDAKAQLLQLKKERNAWHKDMQKLKKQMNDDLTDMGRAIYELWQQGDQVARAQMDDIQSALVAIEQASTYTPLGLLPNDPPTTFWAQMKCGLAALINNATSNISLWSRAALYRQLARQCVQDPMFMVKWQPVLGSLADDWGQKQSQMAQLEAQYQIHQQQWDELLSHMGLGVLKILPSLGLGVVLQARFNVLTKEFNQMAVDLGDRFVADVFTQKADPDLLVMRDQILNHQRVIDDYRARLMSGPGHASDQAWQGPTRATEKKDPAKKAARRKVKS